MNNLRPNTSELYIERSRLLNKLPEESGYVVWLEAPYGYGKRVLAMHWADLLEKDNWRIVWLSLEGRDAKTTISRRTRPTKLCTLGCCLSYTLGTANLIGLRRFN